MEITRAKITSQCHPGDKLIHRISQRELRVLDFKRDREGSYFVCESDDCLNPLILFPISLPHYDLYKLN